VLEHYEALKTLDRIPDHHAALAPEGVALIDRGEEILFAELAERSRRVAAGLHAAGVKPGTRVAVVGPDCGATYEILFGCFLAGAVAVPINWRLDPDELGYILRDAETPFVFAAPEVRAKLEPVVGEATLHIILFGRMGDGGDAGYRAWRDAQPAASSEPRRDPLAPAIQVYTSGTSGRPKGVVLSHRSFLEPARLVEAAGERLIGWRPGDTSLLALPTYHVGGLWWSFHGLANGARNVVLPVFNAPGALAAIARHRVTKCAFVPAMLRFLLSEPEIATTDLGSIEQVIYGGSPMPLPVLEQAVERFDCAFAQNYGLSETCNMAVFLGPDEHGRIPPDGVTGRPLHGIGVKIRDSSGNALPSPEVGEICFRTAGAMIEYWRLPEETAHTLEDGWVRTGDVGFVDAQGFVRITDRLKDLVITAGENVYPAEIERVLLEHPGIADAAVIGIPDERWGEVPLAYVVAGDASLDKPAVMRFLRGRLSAFKIPRTIEFLDALPRNASGKVLKRVLREPYWAGRSRGVG